MYNYNNFKGENNMNENEIYVIGPDGILMTMDEARNYDND